MKKKLLLLVASISFSFVFSQEVGSTKSTMGFYFNPSVHAGLKVVKEKYIPNNTQYIQPQATRKLTYGVTAIGGYHFLPNFAFGAGFRYSFIENNYHLLYLMIQPKIIFTPGDNPLFIELSYGKQVNNSVISDSELWGGRIGMQVSYSKRLSQEGGIVVETYKTGNSTPLFIGLSYGVTIFGNKNYTGYGED
ncbi:hypothetical protein [uncultured Chryseobacterium sp.]|uniref:hypothetical protein n=1 Tax=uncultured Chryseobacterium sp. TaxID=259322 RepID=UPI0025DEB671|nr:hypothetical protein [uncultured Chryseobacterium sp.]